jgi:hypothetical protein
MKYLIFAGALALATPAYAYELTPTCLARPPTTVEIPGYAARQATCSPQAKAEFEASQADLAEAAAKYEGRLNGRPPTTLEILQVRALARAEADIAIAKAEADAASVRETQARFGKGPPE